VRLNLLSFDGSAGSIWHTQWLFGSPAQPHTYTVNMGQPQTVTGFKVLPRWQPERDDRQLALLGQHGWRELGARSNRDLCQHHRGEDGHPAVRINVLALLLTSCLAPCPALATEAVNAEYGQRLFLGAEALRGRIAGHSADIPTTASRCANCHLAPGSRSTAGPSTSPSAAFGPDLTAESLTQARNRRGGPPSRYDQKSLCKVLRTGIDPVHILIPTAMPRYAASDLECAALWGYLSRPAR